VGNWVRRTARLLLPLVALSGLLLRPAPPVQAQACAVTATADGRPAIAPTGAGPGSGKHLGFDNAHGETAGTADWVINGGFGEMACALAGQGYALEEIRAYPLSLGTLRQYDAVVLAEPNIPLTTAEETALTDYVGAGGGLLLVADHYQSDRNLNTWDGLEVLNGWRRGHYGQPFSTPAYHYNGLNTDAPYTFNTENDWLAGAFGLRFRFNALDLADGKQPFHAGNPDDPDDPGILPPDQSLGLTAGVRMVGVYAGSTVSILDPTHALGIVYPNLGSVKAWSHATPSDPVAMYTDAVGDPVCDEVTMGGRCEGALVAVARPGGGKVAAVGDSSLFEGGTARYRTEGQGNAKQLHDGWTQFDHAALGLNLLHWLTTPEAGSGIPVTVQQPLTPDPDNLFQLPEPIPEPWAAPPAGYLWYDAHTFKPGAYTGQPGGAGGGGGGSVEAWSWLLLPAHAYPGNTLAALLGAGGLKPGADYNTQAYLFVTGDGTQVARRYNRSTGAFADPLAPQSLTADSAGRMQRWEFWQLDPSSAERGLSLRLKAGGQTRATSTLTQVTGGSFGHLLVEQTLGFSDGLHAALFRRDGALDTAVRLLPGDDTSVTLPAGTYSVEVRDDAGSALPPVTVRIAAGATSSLRLALDTTPPVTTPLLRAGGSGRLSVSFAATDEGSGVVATHFRVDGGAPQTGSAPLGAGLHRLDFWSTDRAGNAEAPQRLWLYASRHGVLF